MFRCGVVLVFVLVFVLVSAMPPGRPHRGQHGSGGQPSNEVKRSQNTLNLTSPFGPQAWSPKTWTRVCPGPGWCSWDHGVYHPGSRGRTGFQAGVRPDSSRESLNDGPPAGFRPAGGSMWKLSRLKSGQIPARNPDLRPAGTIAQHRVSGRQFDNMWS